MSLSGIILGLINIAIVVAILLLVGAIIMWFCSWIKSDVPANVRKVISRSSCWSASTCWWRCCLEFPQSKSIGAPGLGRWYVT